MRITTKGRYALAACIQIAENNTENRSVTLSDISGKLGVSRLYLEQVLSQLKLGGVISSIKGPKGGFRFAKPHDELTLWEVLKCVETTLAESAEDGVQVGQEQVNSLMNTRVFKPLDAAIYELLNAMTVSDLVGG